MDGKAGTVYKLGVTFAGCGLFVMILAGFLGFDAVSLVGGCVMLSGFALCLFSGLVIMWIEL